jgi:hypothetical protein
MVWILLSRLVEGLRSGLWLRYFMLCDHNCNKTFTLTTVLSYFIDQ